MGDVPPGMRLSHSFSATVIEGRDGLIVTDASADPRFAALPHVVGEPHIRFYAGYPIETPNGQRVGTLNLFDSVPRAADNPGDRPMLRQLGQLLQSELYRGSIAR